MSTNLPDEKQAHQTLVASLLGDREVVAFRPALARALGSPLAALYLCQAIYWQNIAGIGQWWFKLRDADRNEEGVKVTPYNRSRQSWEWELGMSRAEQESARRLLKTHNLIEERRKGVPAKLYYRINLCQLNQFMETNLQSAESNRLDREISPTRRQYSANK